MKEYGKEPETEVEKVSSCQEIAFYDLTELAFINNIATFLTGHYSYILETV